MGRKDEWKACNAYDENDIVRFGEAEYRRCCKEVAERNCRSLYWLSFAGAFLVAVFGFVSLIAGFFEKVSFLYAPMQFATVMVWGYAAWKCYTNNVDIGKIFKED